MTTTMGVSQLSLGAGVCSAAGECDYRDTRYAHYVPYPFACTEQDHGGAAGSAIRNTQ
jgi:hypothetical protein